MKFAMHSTFFIRKGWLSKGMRNVIASPDVFVSKTDNPMDVLGIGANMVKALRYWMVAVGLTTEPTSGQRTQTPTEFGEIVYKHDPYFEETGTLWLLHYQLVKNETAVDTEATAWWYFFNEFKATEFTRDDFLMQFDKFLRNSDEGEKPQRTLEDDFNCIIHSYVSRMKSNPEKVNPESNIDCPLGELGLIDIVGQERNGGRQKIYRKSSPKKDTLHPLIVLAVILYNANGKKEIAISEIQNNNGNVGKAFNLDVISLTALLYKLELMGYIKVNRTAGLDVINIKTNLNFLKCIEQYYREING